MSLVATRSPSHPLLDFWRQTRLRSADAKSSPRRVGSGAQVHWFDALADLLRVGYAICPQSRLADGVWQRLEHRTAPSAGALYPFEIVAALADHPIALWQPERCCFGPLAQPAPCRQDLDDLGIILPEKERIEALIVLLARPWTSMKKYRSRGYAYSHLDIGHAATNLTLYAQALGWKPSVHRRFCRTTMSRVLGLDGSCREPLIALAFSGQATATKPKPSSVSGSESLDPPDEPERANWNHLCDVTSLSIDTAGEPADTATRRAQPLAAAPALEANSHVLPKPQRDGLDVEELRGAILTRRSAKGFFRTALKLEPLSEILAAVRHAELCVDGQLEGARIGLRVLNRRVETADGEPIDGVWTYAAGAHALHYVASRVEDPSRACMGQELARDAAALILFHAPVRPLLERHGHAAFAELHFDVAQLAQRLHLRAASLGVGMTCIGGFDEVESGRLGHLSGDDEVIYLALLGHADARATKHDRDAIAHSHGLTSA